MQLRIAPSPNYCSSGRILIQRQIKTGQSQSELKAIEDVRYHLNVFQPEHPICPNLEYL